MNELIAQLAEQAAQDGALLDNETNLEVYVGDEKSYQVPAAFIESFAKLIVRECSSITLDYKNDEHYNGWLDHQKEILKHFGVEE